MPRAETRERALVLGRQKHQVQQRDREKHHRFRRETRRRRDVHALFDQAVKAETKRQPQTQQRRLATSDGEHDNRTGGNGHADFLQVTQPLAKKHHAQQHIHQRINKIAERRIRHVPRVHCNHIQQPVHRNNYRRRANTQPRTTIRRPQLPDRLRRDNQDEHEHGGPHHTMRQNLQRGCWLQQRKKRGERTPDQVGQHSVKHENRILVTGEGRGGGEYCCVRKT